MFALIDVAFGVLLVVLVLLCVPLIAATFAFWAWMLVDSIRNNRNTPTGRVLWTAAIWFLPLVGSILYFFFGRNRHLTAGTTPATA
jgi:hypothetical protein